ncbi:MAG: class I SAM-dependent methyltransferase [Anaerorhabdus sp.]
MRKYTTKWKDYECLDAGNGEKLERWKDIILRRPDPQAIWDSNKSHNWNSCDAIYHRSNKGGGKWDFKSNIPSFWTIEYNDLTFKVSPTGFKHTGLFPEQAVNWDWMSDKIRSANKEIRVLNLFAYTGGATMACSKAGAAEVVHVDASKGMVSWAKENMKLCKLENNKIRFIVDDVLKFVQREKRRGNTYHAIVMDPPSYGRGPQNEMWKLEDHLTILIDECLKILDKDAIFFLVNSYTTGFSSITLENILNKTILKKYNNGSIEAGEICLPITKDNMLLPCGIYGKWSKE